VDGCRHAVHAAAACIIFQLCRAERFAFTSREHFARNFGASTQEKMGAKTKLKTMTMGRRT
jgi:hypothetical protein